MLSNAQKIKIALRRELFKRSYYEFFLYFWSETSAEELIDNWHIKAICDELQVFGLRLKDRKPKLYDLVLNVPPASSKSTIVTVLFPVWLWTIDPTLKILTGSYAQSLSLEHAVKSRTVINSERFKELYPELILKEDQNNKGSYDNKNKGNRTATSVGSGIIGRHYHIQIIDDPIVATATDLDIKNANEWMTVTLSTRKISKSLTPTILVMQRIHQSDPSAVMMAKKNVKHICLPAELTADTTEEFKKYYIKGLFDIKRLPVEILAETKTELGSTSYSGQYLQNPIPVEGGILKNNWFKYITYGELLLKAKEAKTKLKYELYVDPAYTDKTSNDPSGFVITTKFENNLYVIYANSDWLEFPDLVSYVKKLTDDYNITMVYLEPKASGKSVVQTLKKTTGINVTELESTTDSKLTRVSAASPSFESGRVIIVEGTWNKRFVDECTSFPLGTNDDMLDAVVYSVKRNLIKKSGISYASG